MAREIAYKTIKTTCPHPSMGVRFPLLDQVYPSKIEPINP
jgi:hypothetical protein